VPLADLIGDRFDDYQAEAAPFAAFDRARQRAVEQAARTSGFAAMAADHDIPPEPVLDRGGQPSASEVFFGTSFPPAGLEPVESVFPATMFSEPELAEPFFPATAFAGPEPVESLFPTTWFAEPEPVESLFPATMFEQVESPQDEDRSYAPTPGQGSLFGEPDPRSAELVVPDPQPSSTATPADEQPGAALVAGPAGEGGPAAEPTGTSAQAGPAAGEPVRKPKQTRKSGRVPAPKPAPDADKPATTAGRSRA